PPDPADGVLPDPTGRSPDRTSMGAPSRNPHCVIHFQPWSEVGPQHDSYPRNPDCERNAHPHLDPVPDPRLLRLFPHSTPNGPDDADPGCVGLVLLAFSGRNGRTLRLGWVHLLHGDRRGSTVPWRILRRRLDRTGIY